MEPIIYTGAGSAIDNYLSKYPQDARWGMFDSKKLSHRQILSLVRQLQWTVPNERWGEVADMSGRFANWLKTKSPVKKPLMDMSDAEVSKIIVALENVSISTFSKKR